MCCLWEDSRLFECVEVAQALKTRAQVQKENKPFRPLLTTKMPQLDVMPVVLQTIQVNDKKLDTLRQRVGQPPRPSSQQTSESFVMNDDLLLRRLETVPTHEVIWQLVVPTELRQSVLIAAHDGILGDTWERTAQ